MQEPFLINVLGSLLRIKKQAWDFSGFFRAQKILKSIEIMQSFHISNKNVVKIVPWS